VIKLLRPVWRPTLLRRVLGALLLAFGLVALALLALNFVEFKQGMAEHSGVQVLADGIASSLADLPDARDAGLVMQTRARELNRMRQAGGMLQGGVEFSLRQADGRTVFATPGAAQGSPATHWIAEARGGPWRVTLAEPRVGDATVLGWLGQELLGSLLLAFPLVLLPIWVAVRRGMKPLNQLADTVARRDAQDLSPLGFTPQHDELRRLASAFDGLLARLRSQLQRERAFVQDAAHELRTPMAVMATQAHLLAHAADDAERQQATRALDAAVQRASHLSRQLLTLAALDESGGRSAEALDLADLVQQALTPAAQRAIELGLDLSLDAPASLPVRLERGAFESVLLNLVDNALRYVRAGGRVVVSLEGGGGLIRLQVADDGPGIPPAQRDAAFERFWRGAAGADRPGTGLGLAIVRQAVARLGGRVQIIDGLDGRGVAFIVEFKAEPNT
jgi:two-component system sensor histidine kinase QseC